MKKVFLEFEKVKHPFSGLGEVCKRLGQELVKSKVICPSFYLPKSNFGVFGKDAKYLALNKLHRLFPFLLPKADLYHLIHQDSPYMPMTKNPIIMTIHDLNFLYEQKNDVKQRLRSLQKKIDRVDKLIAISEYTKSDVLKHLQVEKDKIQVIYQGVHFYADQKIRVPVNKPEDDFLFAISIITPKKNFAVLIEMMKLLPNEKLIIGGTTYHPYAQDLIKQVNEEGLAERVTFLGEVRTEEKYWYLKNCKAFFAPSLAEGFGITPIEAMQYGKPVFISNKTSLPEVAGPEAYVFEDFSSESMVEVFTNGMKEYSQDSEKSERLKKWANRYSWEKSAKEHIDLYQSL